MICKATFVTRKAINVLTIMVSHYLFDENLPEAVVRRCSAKHLFLKFHKIFRKNLWRGTFFSKKNLLQVFVFWKRKFGGCLCYFLLTRSFHLFYIKNDRTEWETLVPLFQKSVILSSKRTLSVQYCTPILFLKYVKIFLEKVCIFRNFSNYV